MQINQHDYRSKVLGCWYGKNIGGTLGMPFEWKRQLNDVDFYTQKLDGNPLPNDDLDIQLLWLIAMEQQGVDIDCRTLGHYFNVFVTPHWAEYGLSKANMKSGIAPPYSGLVNNNYKHSCGSYIRSEIWACIAPGHPERAVRYMYEDSCVDHGGHSEGTYAAVFVAAMQSAAFVVSDIDSLIDIGLSFIPSDCAIAKVTALVRKCRKDKMSWKDARREVLAKFRGAPFTYFTERETVKFCSEDDKKLGFDKGERGYDVPSNLGIVIIGLLYGEGDFENSILIANNCGEDTDCTAATVGATLGIISGESGIPKKWIEPIGTDIVTCCLNYGELDGVKGLIPGDIFNLTDRTAVLAKKVAERYGSRLPIVPQGTSDLGGKKCDYLCTEKFYRDFYGDFDKSVYRFPFFDIKAAYLDGISIAEGQTCRVAVDFVNTYRVSENLSVKLYCDPSLTVDQRDLFFFAAKDNYSAGVPKVTFAFSLTQGADIPQTLRAVLQVEIIGRSEVMLVPILFKKAAKNMEAIPTND